MKFHPITLDAILQCPENEHLECKEAKNSFGFEKLVKYCAAFANENGGCLALGVTDKIPRKIVGTQAFRDLDNTKSGVIEQLKIRIDVQEEITPQGRVLIFNIPSRPIGVPIGYKDVYWMRTGEDTVPMTSDVLKRIFDETAPDFSAETCPGLTLNDLVPEAIEKFRMLWLRKSGHKNQAGLAHEQLLTDSELLAGNRLTYASLILFGSRQSLGKFLPQAEIIFEYRAREITCPAQQRLEFREGWFLYEEKLLEAVNLRNENQHFQDGLFVWDIPTFNSAVIREAVLNAFCHRDYRQPGSIFIRQFPRKMEIENPGGFPPGINLDNILQRQAPRNRRIAETLQRCGLVERSGQGVNLMFEECIRESKSLPDFSGTDGHHVSLLLYGEVNDPQFLRFLEKVGKEKQVSFTTGALMALDQIHRAGKVSTDLKNCLPSLLEQGLVEKSGRGKYVLSRNFYKFIGRKGVYTRKKGLDRETNKQLLLKHIQDNQKEGSRLGELVEVLPSLTRRQVQKLLQELKSENRVFCIGQTNAGKWFPGKGEVIAPKPDLN